MKKSFWIIWLIVVLVLRVGGKYNGLVTLEEQVEQSWAQVENQYQRRTDLIPNLVNTVKWFAEQEESVLVGVVEARAKATQTQVNLENPASLEAFQSAQGDLSSALSRLLVTVESYPELKSDQTFLNLQTQLEGTENRIAVERMKYNETATTYNTRIRQFPANIAAMVFGFDRKALFEAQEGSEVAPTVDFGE